MVRLAEPIGDISRFPSAGQLVCYAEMGTRVHDSGQTHNNRQMTKAGRKDIGWVMIETAHHAARRHPCWKAELARLGHQKAIIAIAWTLLGAVRHALSTGYVDRLAEPTNVARSMFGLAYDVGVANLPDGHSAKSFTCEQLDRLGIGKDLETMPWGSKKVKLPRSRLANKDGPPAGMLLAPMVL